MEENPTILVVDAEPDHRLLLATTLQEELPFARIHEAEGMQDALTVISALDVDVVLCESLLGESTGLDLLEKSRKEGVEAAFLLVTNHGSEEVARQAFVRGAADYVTKDAAFENPADLVRRVRRALEKKRLTEARHRAELLLENFLENNPYAIVICDHRGRVVRWNRTLTQMEGRPRDLVRFRTAYSPLQDPQLMENGVAERLENALSGQWVKIPPFPWDPHKSGFRGPKRILHGVAFPVGSIGEHASHLCLMFRDVTAEETARRERDEYAAVLAGLLNASRAAILFVDPQRNVRFANRYVEEFFGVDPVPFVGGPNAQLAAHLAEMTWDRHAFLQRIEYLYENVGIEADDMVEVWHPRRRYLRRHSGPVHDPAGQVLGRIEVYVDETEELERQHFLEAQNRELDAFASRLAHDLKTPLVSLKGFTDLLNRQHFQQLDTRGRMYLEKVRSSAALLDEMVDGLRELARAGERAHSQTAVDSLPVLRLACESVRDLASERGVEIHLPSQGVPVRCERARLYQILQNLLSNAVRYADPTKPKRWVRVRAEASEHELSIEIRDNGLGMDPNELTEMFRPFRRGRNTGGTSGMGLGLAITQRIVQASGGRIEAESSPGEGTRFTIVLPRGPQREPSHLSPS